MTRKRQCSLFSWNSSPRVIVTPEDYTSSSERPVPRRFSRVDSKASLQVGKASDRGHSKPIIIVGAGAIGLATAYYLASQDGGRERSGLKREIIVLEAGDRVFNAASGHNSGCVAFHWLEDPIRELGEYSYREFKRLYDHDVSFRDTCGFEEGTLYNLDAGDNVEHVEEENTPRWLRRDNDWRLTQEPLNGEAGAIDPDALGSWLESECRRLGVQIMLSASVQSARLSRDNVVESVTICQTATGDKATIRELRCQKLMLAAGPWTPKLLNELFPANSVGLQAETDSGDWILLRNDYSRSPSSKVIGVFMDNIVDEKLEFVSRMDGTIWMCGRQAHGQQLPDPGTRAEVDEKQIAHLLDHAARFLRQANQDDDVLDLVEDTGRDFRPTIKRGIPIIGEIRSDLLQSSQPRRTKTKGSGVFVNSGHNFCGISLSLGSGKLASALVLGRKPEIESLRFNIGKR